jgi:hypothetical protein
VAGPPDEVFGRQAVGHRDRELGRVGSLPVSLSDTTGPPVFRLRRWRFRRITPTAEFTTRSMKVSSDAFAGLKPSARSQSISQSSC